MGRFPVYIKCSGNPSSEAIQLVNTWNGIAALEESEPFLLISPNTACPEGVLLIPPPFQSLLLSSHRQASVFPQGLAPAVVPSSVCLASLSMRKAANPPRFPRTPAGGQSVLSLEEPLSVVEAGNTVSIKFLRTESTVGTSSADYTLIPVTATGTLGSRQGQCPTKQG